MESWAELRTISRQASSSRRAGYASGRLEECGQRLGPPLQLALGQGALALHVDPVRGDPHEHVGPEARAQLALDDRQALGARAGQVARQGGDFEVEVVLQVVGLRHDAAEPWLWHQVVGPVHAQEVAGDEATDLLEVVGRPAHERLGVVGERGAVAVADGQVLGPDGRSVGCLPHEGVLRSPPTARHARRRRRRTRRGAGSGASARCGRTCRAGSRRPWCPRRRRRAACPSAGCARWSRPRPGTRP